MPAPTADRTRREKEHHEQSALISLDSAVLSGDELKLNLQYELHWRGGVQVRRHSTAYWRMPHLSTRADIHIIMERSDGQYTEQWPARLGTSHGLFSGAITYSTFSSAASTNDMGRRQTWALKGFIVSSGERLHFLRPALSADRTSASVFGVVVGAG